MDSRHSQRRSYLTRETGNYGNHQMCSRSSFKLQFWVSIFQNSIFSKALVCLRLIAILQVSSSTVQWSMSKKTYLIELTSSFLKYTNKSVFDIKVRNRQKVRFVCFTLIQFKRDRKLSHSRLRQASRSMRRAFTPPPLRGREESDSNDSAANSQINNHCHWFMQRLGQDASHEFAESSTSATQRCSFTQVILTGASGLCGSYSLSLVKLLLAKVKEHAGWCCSRACQCHSGEGSASPDYSAHQSRKASRDSWKELIAITS